MKGKIFFAAFAALISSLAVADFVTVYENDFESYELGEVRKPVQDGAPFVEYNAPTNLIYCNVESDCGVEESKGVHFNVLKEDGQAVTGGAQFNTGIDPELFNESCEVIYEIAWRPKTNLSSVELTDGTNLFFRLFANGGTARRVCCTNLVYTKTIELIGGDGEVGLSNNSFCFYKIHVLFPDGRITLIERDTHDGKHFESVQPEIYGFPSAKPTHIGGGIRERSYGVNDRDGYIDNIKVSYEVISNPKMSVYGQNKVLINDKDPVLTVSNIGTGSFVASVEVLEGSGYFSFAEDTEKIGSFNVEVKKAAELHTVIDRETLGVAFGRAKVKITGAGSEEIVTYYIQSGSPEEGYMLYASDFEDVVLGPVIEVDPNWVASGTIAGCEVVQDPEAGQCLKIETAKGLHLNCNMPEGLSDKYDVRVSMKACMPNYSTLSQVAFGTDLSHRQGEYSLRPKAEGIVSFTCDNCVNTGAVTNQASTDEWFDFSYTYNSQVENRICRGATFDGCEYELNMPIDLGGASGSDKDFFNQFRVYAFTSDTLFFLDDIEIALVPRAQGKPPVMSVRSDYDPVPYNVNTIPIKIFNIGGGSFDYKVTIVEGANCVRLSKAQGTVDAEDSISAIVRRSNIGFGFHTATLRFTSTTEGVEPFDLKLHIQAGNNDEGYMLYESDFDSLELTKDTATGLVNELSEQDSCWLITNSKNRIDVVKDPENEENQCLKLMDLNHSSSGYHLALNVPAEAAEDFDVVYAMRLRIPDDYIDDEELGSALFCVSQENSSRKCEAKLYLNEETTELPVYTHLEDLQDQEWWDKEKETAEPVGNNEWFNFYMRFNCKFVDYDHKVLSAYNFGPNEYSFEGEEGYLTYPNGGIKDEVLQREDLSKLKLYSYKKQAGILLDDLKVYLVPKSAIPEPAFFGLLAIVAALALRKRS